MENGKKKYLDGDGARYLVQQMQKGVDVVRENVDFNNEILYGRTGVPRCIPSTIWLMNRLRRALMLIRTI